MNGFRQMSLFAVTKYPTPLLNTPCQFSQTEKDSQGRFMVLETVLFPGSLITVINKADENIWEVSAQEYPSSLKLYTYSHFLYPTQEAQPRTIQLPPSSDILHTLTSLVGHSYVWGGNWPSGIPQIKEHDPLFEETIPLKGIDCSGLLYFATNGATPRNTSDLICFGKEVCDASLPEEEIQKQLKPLDIIAWRGHVLIVLSPEEVIESRIGRGVVITPFIQRFKEIKTIVQSEGKQLFIRRWYPLLSLP